jgi:hypothetical protein
MFMSDYFMNNRTITMIYYNYLCIQCLSPLKLCVRMLLNTALCDKVFQWLATGRWFSPVSLFNSLSFSGNRSLSISPGVSKSQVDYYLVRFFSVISIDLCDKVFQWLATGRWFSPVSSNNKTDRDDITEVLSKVALYTITLSPSNDDDICAY